MATLEFAELRGAYRVLKTQWQRMDRRQVDRWPDFNVLVGSIEKALDDPNTSKALEYFGNIGGMKQALLNVLLSWGLYQYDAFALYSFDKLLGIAVQFLHVFTFGPEEELEEKVFAGLVKTLVIFREDLWYDQVLSQVGLILKEGFTDLLRLCHQKRLESLDFLIDYAKHAFYGCFKDVDKLWLALVLCDNRPAFIKYFIVAYVYRLAPSLQEVLTLSYSDLVARFDQVLKQEPTLSVMLEDVKVLMTPAPPE
jgi:hypothetical protein